MWEDGRVGAPERIEGWRGIEEGRVEGERSERDLKGWEVEERGGGYATMLKPLKKDTREEAIKGG